MIKNYYSLFLLFILITTTTIPTATSVEVVNSDQAFTSTQRFTLYTAIYLDQMPKPKKELLAHFKTDDTNDADFALIIDNALLANLTEIIQDMTYDELHTNIVMNILAQVLSYESLKNEPSIQSRKAQIVEILRNKKVVSR